MSAPAAACAMTVQYASACPAKSGAGSVCTIDSMGPSVVLTAILSCWALDTLARMVRASRLNRKVPNECGGANRFECANSGYSGGEWVMNVTLKTKTHRAGQSIMRGSG